MIVSGATDRTGSFIASGAVVMKDVPKYAMVGIWRKWLRYTGINS